MNILTYNGKSFNQREEDGYVNVGQLCATHDKRFNHWSTNAASQEYLEALSLDTGIPVADLVRVSANAIGGTGTTWAHPLAAIEVARWISPTFGVWCNKQIKTLIETGTTSLTTQQDDEQSWLKFGYGLIEEAMSEAGLPKALSVQVALAGVREAAPRLAKQIEPAMQALINSTASASQLLNVTQLGKELGISAKATNKLLIEKGFQVVNSKKISARDLNYQPTELGERYSQVVQSADSKGKTFQQLRWQDEIVGKLS